ncbi:MAG: tetraacyldisaccharide 4'-kinase [Steroidobacteraceae bacterium]
MSTRLHDWLLATWYGGAGSGWWLQPFAWLFAGAARMRRALYARGWLASYWSRRPVIVVGNLTVGGTGKTPFVVWLARQLRGQGLRVGIATRGYGGSARGARRLEAADTAASAGDEAVLLRRKLGLPVAVGARRAEAVRLLEDDCDVVVCDDGLQHYALARDVEIAVVDGARGLGNGRRLPAGPLREPGSRLSEVDAVVVNGAGFDWPEAIRMRIEPVAAVALAGGARRLLAEFAGRPVTAVAAIGNPARFFGMLRAHGLDVAERALPDHALVTPAAAGIEAGDTVLMTEKDAVKCAGDRWLDAWYIEADARVDAAAAASLLARIAERFAQRRTQRGTNRE